MHARGVPPEPKQELVVFMNGMEIYVPNVCQSAFACAGRDSPYIERGVTPHPRAIASINSSSSL
jgi:hypothetical protein